MDEAQIKALIEAALAPAIKGAFGEFRSYFSEQLNPINERLSQFEVGTPETPTPTQETVSTPNNQAMEALTARLAQMEKMEADRQTELRQYKFQGELSSQVSKYDPLHQDMVKELLANRYANTVEKGGKYYTPQGSTLDEEVDGFFKSEVGSHFLKAPAATPGGTQKSNVPSNGNRDEPSLDDMLADMTF